MKYDSWDRSNRLNASLTVIVPSSLYSLFRNVNNTGIFLPVSCLLIFLLEGNQGIFQRMVLFHLADRQRSEYARRYPSTRELQHPYKFREKFFPDI